MKSLKGAVIEYTDRNWASRTGVVIKPIGRGKHKGELWILPTGHERKARIPKEAVGRIIQPA